MDRRRDHVGEEGRAATVDPGRGAERLANRDEELGTMRPDEAVLPAIVVAGDDDGRHFAAERLADPVEQADEVPRRLARLHRRGVEHVARDGEQIGSPRTAGVVSVEGGDQSVEDARLLDRVREQVQIRQLHQVSHPEDH